MEACIARAGGNPLFLVQLLQNTVESHSAAVPASIRSLVLARIDRLAPRDKEAIQAASLIGQRFALALLRHLVDDGSYDCSALLAHDLVRSEGEDFLFAHALIQEGTYSSLLHSRKRELHGKAARWFAGRDSVLHAEHLDRAEDPGAAAAYLDAGRVLAAHMQFARALALAERGASLTAAQAVRHGLALLRGQLLRDLGRNSEALAAFEAARELASDAVEGCRARIELASAHRNVSAIEPALAMLAEAQPVAERSGLALERSRIHYMRGNLYFALGRPDECSAEHERALDLARAAGSAECEAQALSGLGDVGYARGRMRSAGERFEQCLATCEREGLLRFSVMNRAMVAWCRYFCGEVGSACALLEDVSHLAAQLGHANAEVMTRQSLAFMLVWRGALDPAQLACERGLALARELGAKRYEAMLQYARGLILVRRGRRGEAMECMRTAWRLVEETGAYGFFGPPALGGLACASESEEERSAALQRAEAMLGESALAHCSLYFHSEALADAGERGRWAEIDRYTAALERVTAAEPLPWADFQVRLWRALARHGRGERSDGLRDLLLGLREEAGVLDCEGMAGRLEATLAQA